MTAPPLERGRQFADAVLKPMAQAAGMNARAAVRTRRLGHLGYTGATITDYDPFDPATAAQPYDAYRRLHESGGVHYNPKRAIWVIHRMEDVRNALRETGSITSAEGVIRLRFSLPLMVATDGPQHAALRKQVLPAFTKNALESWRPIVDRLATELVSDLIANPGSDMVRDLAVPMPVRLIGEILGVPEEDGDDFRRWSEQAIQLLDFSPTWASVRRTVGAAGGGYALLQYLSKQLASGRLKGEGSVLGRLLENRDEGTLTDSELVLIALLLLMAGNETTTNLLGGMFDTYARHPEQYEMIRADPELIPMAIEEHLRHLSPLQGLYRSAIQDYTIGNVTIPAGARVLVSFAAANQDPTVFDDPATFRADRNPKQHVAFGYGPHLCLGAALARMEATAVLRELTTRVKEIRPDGTTTWSTNSSLRGPVRFPVTLEEA
ncbi:cytochrome P450 [Marmoricola sp. OAE513]|uniref:cytochrome P450 n=1 Tax=Marmoricola sp. OAE513 TaxID=2817894 RepID=UPI001AE2597B